MHNGALLSDELRYYAQAGRSLAQRGEETLCILVVHPITNTAKILRAKFFLSYLKAPGSVGAIAPSSAFLAKALCRHARGAQHLIELGAGTGAVTRHLREEFPAATLVVVERDEPMAAALRRRFVNCTVVADAVQSRKDLFKGIPERSVTVSSLPFRSLPEAVAEQVIILLQDFLLASPKRRLVQYTYGQRVPFDSPHLALVWKRQRLVLRNIPPAWVWTLQQSRTSLDCEKSSESFDALHG